jgi:hypothetical protein
MMIFFESSHMSNMSKLNTRLDHLVGRPGKDDVLVFCAEKCNSAVIARAAFERIGLLAQARQQSRGQLDDNAIFVHNFRCTTYKRSLGQVPSILDVRRAKRAGASVLRFVRDPVDRFLSIWKRYKRFGTSTDGILYAPKGLKTTEGFLQWLEKMGPEKLIRYHPRHRRGVDLHIAAQTFYGEDEAPDLFTETIQVETLRDPAVCARLKQRYGLNIRANGRSAHWTEQERVTLNDNQKARVRKLYARDMRFSKAK